MRPINWSLIGDAVRHYTGLGYQYIEVPWIVPQEIVDMTAPAPEFGVRLEPNWRGNRPFAEAVCGDATAGVLVGSAEQSFLHMQRRGELPAGRYVACSPCFRNEPSFGRLHQPTFMKVELYCNDVHGGMMFEIVDFAWSFFAKVTGPDDVLSIVETPDGCDIEVNGWEVGSYGIREIDGLRWVYGTGVAEPRLSSVRLSVDPFA